MSLILEIHFLKQAGALKRKTDSKMNNNENLTKLILNNEYWKWWINWEIGTWLNTNQLLDIENLTKIFPMLKIGVIIGIYVIATVSENCFPLIAFYNTNNVKLIQFISDQFIYKGLDVDSKSK